MFVRMKFRSFHVDLKQGRVDAFSSTISDLVLWHKTIRHVNYSNLKHLSMEGMVEVLPFIESCKTVCEVYQMGKQARIDGKTSFNVYR